MVRPFWTVGQLKHGADQVSPDDAADAAVGQTDHTFTDIGDQLGVDVDRTKIIDHHGNTETVIPFQDVVDQIQEAIISGKIEVGEKLPPERELKDMLQTSRSTIREALRVLEQKGLIEIKLGMGGGAIVKTVSSDQVTESLDLLIKSQNVSLNHLAEFRERVEGDVAELAAERVTDEDILNLKALLEDAKKYVDMGVDHVTDFWEADKILHLAIADISGNPIYISICKTIHYNIIHYLMKYLPMKINVIEENYKDLCDIVESVELGNSEAARNYAKEHVRRFNQYMKKMQEKETV